MISATTSMAPSASNMIRRLVLSVGRLLSIAVAVAVAPFDHERFFVGRIFHQGIAIEAVHMHDFPHDLHQPLGVFALTHIAWFAPAAFEDHFGGSHSCQRWA